MVKSGVLRTCPQIHADPLLVHQAALRCRWHWVSIQHPNSRFISEEVVDLVLPTSHGQVGQRHAQVSIPFRLRFHASHKQPKTSLFCQCWLYAT